MRTANLVIKIVYTMTRSGICHRTDRWKYLDIIPNTSITYFDDIFRYMSIIQAKKLLLFSKPHWKRVQATQRKKWQRKLQHASRRAKMNIATIEIIE